MLEQANKVQNKRPTDVTVGALVGFSAQGHPLVVFAGNPSQQGLEAKSTVQLETDDIGCHLALLFENGDANKPLIIGRIVSPQPARKEKTDSQSLNVKMDGDTLCLRADQQIELKCGKASITLTKAGKVLIRGAYILSRSSGANRIKGGAIQLN
ncbi:DUF6484 domain-containing protein [Bowmanella pacifica]|uniref:DUF6484 domain-containing protein n=1 Tax=Bowmanella pacifica TaxID=502051 RepID=A0A917YUG7_9ALTE|nr:DUF6484 domain-containing protein [Bowmanella pacifica]GGO66684.1 hypothetical protein GCM10010982_11460 [Bowmanella pacifica]